MRIIEIYLVLVCGNGWEIDEILFDCLFNYFGQFQ